MTNLKGMISSILIASLLLFSAACGSADNGTVSSNGGQNGGTENTGGNSAPAEPTTLTFWTFLAHNVTFYEHMTERWNEEHPDEPVILEISNVPYYEMHNNLLIALQSGVGAPDIVNIEFREIARFTQGTEEDIQLVPLNDLVEPYMDVMVQSRFIVYSKDGNYYAIPTQVGSTSTFWNTEVTDAAGIDPWQIETWDDYIEAGLVIKEKTGKWLTTVEITDPFSFWPFISQRGSDFVDEDGNVIIDNDINIDTLQKVQDLVYKHEIAIPAPGGQHVSEEYYAFFSDNQVASVIMPAFYMSRFRDYMPHMAGKIVQTPMPTWEPGGSRSAGMGGAGTAITKQTEHLDLVLRFVEFTRLSKESQIALWTISGAEPPRWDVWDEPALREPNALTEVLGDGIFDLLSEIRDDINPLYIRPATSRAADLVSSQLMHQVIREGADVESTLRRIGEEIRAAEGQN